MLGLVDLRGRDLEAIDLEQYAQFAVEGLHVRCGEGVVLVETGEDHLQVLLDAVARFRIYPGQAFVRLPQPADQSLHELHRAVRIGPGGGDELVVGNHQAFGVGKRLDRGRSRPRLDQAHLTEHVAGIEDPDALGLGTLAYAHLDGTCADQKGGIAGLAFGEDRVSGVEFHGLHRKALFLQQGPAKIHLTGWAAAQRQATRDA